VLVLTRRKNQSIVIGSDIVVTVLDVKGDQIRLGITAPREVQVYREELLAGLPETVRLHGVPQEVRVEGETGNISP
jgi:carbon storage regulator